MVLKYGRGVSLHVAICDEESGIMRVMSNEKAEV